jgi:hypothetical protein
MPSDRGEAERIFARAVVSTGDVYLDAEARLRAIGDEGLSVARSAGESLNPVERLLGQVILERGGERAREFDEVLAYLDGIGAWAAKTPRGEPSIDGIPIHLHQQYGDRVAPLLALRLIKCPQLPRWYAFGVIAYLVRERTPESTDALIYYVLGEPKQDRRRQAAAALITAADPLLYTKLRAARIRVFAVGDGWPEELRAIFPDIDVPGAVERLEGSA